MAAREPFPVRGIVGEVLAQVAERESDVAGLVVPGQSGDPAGDRIRSAPFEERKQGQEAALAEDREQERRGGPVGLVEQGLQRRPAAVARHPEGLAASAPPGG